MKIRLVSSLNYENLLCVSTAIIVWLWGLDSVSSKSNKFLKLSHIHRVFQTRKLFLVIAQFVPLAMTDIENVLFVKSKPFQSILIRIQITHLSFVFELCI